MPSAELGVHDADDERQDHQALEGAGPQARRADLHLPQRHLHQRVKRAGDSAKKHTKGHSGENSTLPTPGCVDRTTGFHCSFMFILWPRKRMKPQQTLTVLVLNDEFENEDDYFLDPNPETLFRRTSGGCFRTGTRTTSTPSPSTPVHLPHTPHPTPHTPHPTPPALHPHSTPKILQIRQAQPMNELHFC